MVCSTWPEWPKLEMGALVGWPLASLSHPPPSHLLPLSGLRQSLNEVDEHIILSISFYIPSADGVRAKTPKWTRIAPEVGPNWSHLKFKGRGQRETPVTDAKGIVEVIMLFQGQQAARETRS